MLWWWHMKGVLKMKRTINGKEYNIEPGANLQGANLYGADLKQANLYGADLKQANLQGAYLQGAYLQGANLQGSDLYEANLQGADLRQAYLYGANLKQANLDFSYLPLWCGSFGMKVSPDLIYQLIYHICNLDCDDPILSGFIKREGYLANRANIINRHSLPKIKRGK